MKTALKSVSMLACMVLLPMLFGCAAGRNDATGEIVVGFGVAKLTESVNQGIAQLGDMVLPGAGAALAAIGVPVIGWARAHAKARAATAASEEHDRAWNEAAATYSAPPPSLPSGSLPVGNVSGGNGGGVSVVTTPVSSAA